MTTGGPRLLWTVLAVTVVAGLVASVAGCASFGRLTAVTVSDVKSVAGTWQGVIYRSGFDPDYVTLTIQEDGSFDIVATQRIGSSRGKGKITVRDGRLLFEGEGGGRGVATLLKSPAGDLVMNVEGTLRDNSTVSAKLSPSR